jgi:uncharacterized protein YecE (DUF72 family)
MSSAEPEATGGAGEIRIGISGWRYPPWRGGAFYPKGLAQHRELEYASRELPSIELNGSFYSLQRPENYAGWYEDTPKGFVFSVKGSRYITHMLRPLGDAMNDCARDACLWRSNAYAAAPSAPPA